jgi:transposase
MLFLPIVFCMALHGSRKDAERRRLQAMMLLEQGCCQSEVARQVGVTPGAVSQWVKAYRRDGPDALKAKVHSGPKPKLSPPPIERLQKLLLQGATPHGFATELWTLARIVAVVRKHFGVTYDPSGIWHVLRRMGWSCQKPERRARERDEQAVAAWRQEDWPRIKKRPPKR